MPGPAFADAYRHTWLVALLAAALAAAHWLAVQWLRPWIVGAVLVLTAYVVARAVVLLMLERRQREFEPLWLQAQSEVLRGAWFEVVRFSVEDTGQTRTVRRRFDLTRAADVTRLLGLQAAEKRAGRSSQVTIEFVCPPVQGRAPELQSAQVGLAELGISGRSEARFAEVRFPAASYHAWPQADALGGQRPSQTTFWVLSDAVVTAVMDR